MIFPLDGPSAQSSISVTTSPQEVKAGVSPLAERKVITVQPVNGTIRVTFESGKPGFYLLQGGFYSFEATDKQPLYAYTDSGTVTAIIAERA